MSAPSAAPKLDLDKPVREELRAGLDQAKLLPTGHGYASIDAGVNHLWTGDTSAFMRLEAGWHPTDSLTAFGYAQADLQGVQAGVGARVTF